MLRSLRMPAFVLAAVLVVVPFAGAKTNYAYVANVTDNTVSVINTGSNTVVKTIPVGTTPFIVAVDEAGKSAYVTNFGSNTVSVISTTTNAVTATIPVQTQPQGLAVAPNGKTVYVSNGGSGTVSVINPATKKVTTTISLGGQPAGIAVTPSGTFAYVANYGANNVAVVSPTTNAVVTTVPTGNGPTGVAISPDGTAVYVTNQTSTSVTVIQTATNTVANTITLTSAPYGTAVSPDGQWVYVPTSGSVTVIDAATGAVAATIPTGAGTYFLVSFSQDSAFAYVTESGTNTVYVINTESKTVAKTVTVGNSPAGVAVMGTVHVSTVAGGWVGDKGPATGASLSGPYTSVLDGAGNLYIADVWMNRIRKVTPGGASITTYAGTGICGYNGEGLPAAQTNICASDAVNLDPAGNVVVSGDLRIRKIDKKTGIATTIAGNGLAPYNPSDDGKPALQAAVGQVFQITYDTAGNMFFASVGQCTVRKIDTSGIIHTVAGTGTCGYNGDGIPAVTAQLNLPRGVAVDGSGNVYIGDTRNHRVRKVDGSGTISTFAGTGQGGFTCNPPGPAVMARVGSPRMLTIFQNALYIGNAGAEVCVVDLGSDNISLYAGSTPGYDGDGHSLLTSEFELPTFVLFDPNGNPVFDDAFNTRVRRASGGILSTYAGGYVGEGVKATSGAFTFPEALAIDKAGNFYVADYTGNRIRKVSGGKISTLAGNGITGFVNGAGAIAQFNQPQGIAVDSTGNVFVADSSNDVIRKIDTLGNVTTFSTNSNFGYPFQMTIDSANNLYVADLGSCVVWKITPANVTTVVAGVLFNCGYNGDNIQATTAWLNGPYSVALDKNGNLLIADNGNNRIREVNTSGIISTITGDGNCGYSGNGGLATAAEICGPYGVVADKSGNVYLSDANLTVRKISGGMITGFAGTGPGGFGFNGDGYWPLLTNLSDPIALGIDSKGAIYVLDDVDHRIRKIQ